MIPAGGSGKLVARVHTGANQNGRFSKGVTVHTDEPGSEDLRLSFSYQVSAPVVVRPNGRVIVAGVEGRQIDRWLRLTGDADTPLELTRIDNPAPTLLQITSGRVGEGDRPEGLSNVAPGDVWVRLHVAPEVTASEFDGVVKLATNHPERPLIQVPVQVRIRPLISAAPKTVDLSTGSDPRQPHSMVVRLGHNGGKPFRITGMLSSVPELVGATQVSSGSQVSHLIRIALVASDMSKVPSSGVSATVRVATDEPARPEVVIPVEVHGPDS